jgi:hypothetical protein
MLPLAMKFSRVWIDYTPMRDLNGAGSMHRGCFVILQINFGRDWENSRRGRPGRRRSGRTKYGKFTDTPEPVRPEGKSGSGHRRQRVP